MMPKRILVVDPTSDTRKSIEEIFDLHGDQVIFAKDEPEALSIVQNIQFDLILIEVLLPRGNGYSLCNQIRQLERTTGAHTPILIMGGVLRNFNLAHEARIKHGADDVLVKPFDGKDLLRKLSIFLDGFDPEIVGDLDPDAEAGSEDAPFIRLYVDPLRTAGSLSRVPFARVLGGFWQIGETGILHVQSGKVRKDLYWQNGNLVFVNGGNRRECLGWILEREKLLTHDELKKYWQAMNQTGKKLGEVLLEEQRIGPHDLFQMMQKEFEEKVFHLFRWQEGNYWFDPLPTVVTPEIVPLSIDVRSLLRRGVEDIHSIATLQREFEYWLTAVVQIAAEGPKRLSKLAPTHGERKLWELIDGQLTLAEILAKTELENTAAMRFIYLLLCVDAISMNLERRTALCPQSLLLPLGDGQYRKEIETRFTRTYSYSPAELLGTSPADPISDPSPIYREACHRLLSRRLFFQSDLLTQVKAETIFDRLTDAYRIFVGVGDERPAAGQDGREISPAGKAKILEAEMLFQEGMAALATENYLQAIDRFQAAVDLDENTADYHAYLGYAHYKQRSGHDQTEPTQALRYLNKALELDFHLPDAFLFFGQIYSDLGQDKRAETYYEGVLANDPNNLEALKQLRMIYANRKAQVLQDEEVEAGEAAPDDELKEYQKRIKTFFLQIQGLNYYQVLGVKPDIGAKELQKVYFELAARFRSAQHYQKANPVAREQADEIFTRLTVAYTILSSDDSRQCYDEEMKRHQNVNPRQPVSPGMRQQAAEHFQRGMRYLNNRDFKNAVEQFGEAQQAVPSQVSYLAWLGYALYLQASQLSDEEKIMGAIAREYLRLALLQDPGNADAAFLHGQIYLMEGRRNLAEEQYNNALLSDPDRLEALKAYRQIHYQGKGYAPIKLSQNIALEQDHRYLELLETLDLLYATDFFAILEISPDASPVDVKTAYDRYLAGLLANFDQHHSLPEIRYLLGLIRTRLDRAYRILADNQTRAAYLAALEDREEGATAPAASAFTAAAVAAPPADAPSPAGDEPTSEPFWKGLKGKFRKK
ncbi:MAG: response regulator [Myxococcales bacterium]|nr:response regulator [Myxococcales bacterium]